MEQDKKFALLIDADNIGSQYIKTIIDELTDSGVVTIKRIYGDWTKPNLDSSLFEFEQFDMLSIPHRDHSFTKIIANHVMFYAKDLHKAVSEIARVLTKDGTFYCSSYGNLHMKEITELVKEFDPRISLSSTNLYEIFGLENGKALLEEFFDEVELIRYEDALIVDDYQAIIDYILSCHGNQNDYISNRYESFKHFIQGKMKNGSIKITKDAGIFRCRKKKN